MRYATVGAEFPIVDNSCAGHGGMRTITTLQDPPLLAMSAVDKAG